MKKIPDEMDNPIDNILIRFSEYICPFFKKTGHTPNTITTYSLITGILSVYFLYIGRPIAFAILYSISYFFDCMDGHFARKYNMTSKGGDLYDHIKDISVYILLIYVVCVKYKNVIKVGDIVVLFLAILSCVVHIGCQQKQMEKDYDETLDSSKCFCPNKEFIYYTRWCGMGTLMLITIGLVLFIHYRR